MMLLWPIIVLLLIGTLAALLYPLYRGRDTLETREAFDANVFKDQLKAIDREHDEGQIELEDAESARIEISRKLLAAADKADKAPIMQAEGRKMSRSMAIVLALAVPLSAVGLYLKVGSPLLPDLPLEARAKIAPVTPNKIASLIARAEERLAQKPGDGQGWEIMAPIYLRHQMYDKAAAAYKNSIKLLGSNAERLSGLADSIVLANDGIVADDVLPILKRAIKADPNHPKPHFWMGLYYEQNNKFKQAEDLYTTLLQNAGAQVVWRPTVLGRLNEVRKKQGLPATKIAGTKSTPVPEIKLGNELAKSQATAANTPPPPGPTADDIKRAGQMSAGDRKTMINSMVARLSGRLYEQGGDVKSWMRLVNVLNVQGKKVDALKAVQAGKKNLAGNAQAVSQLDALSRQLGLVSVVGAQAVPPAAGNRAPPGPTADDIKRAGQMSAGDRNTMINNMVARLSDRLYQQGGDIKSWIRLVNVLNVQGKKAEAQKAVQAGKRNLGNNAQAVAQLTALARQLGLGS